MRRLTHLMIGLVLAVATGAGADLPTVERVRVERLLHRLSDMQGIEFIRNGKSYDAATAVRFLRRKWEAQADSVTNAESFITHVATKSATTGKAYELRFGGGAVTNVADVLRLMLDQKD